MATVMTVKVEAPKKRSPVVHGMQMTQKAKKFRHRADRRPKDARRSREWQD